jgi:uncharacterized protein YndB with AHSA1/START domain
VRQAAAHEGLSVEMSVLQPGSRTLVIDRVFDAPPELVRQAWTEREHAVHWWGRTRSRHRSSRWICARAARGVRSFAPDGAEYPQHGIVREVVAPVRLVFTLIWDSAPQEEHLVTITFAARGKRTAMHFTKGPFTHDASQRGEESGWNQSLDRLAAYVAAG